MTTLSACVEGIGVLGPGLNGWPDAAAVLRGEAPYAPAPTVVPAPACLAGAERRRTGTVVRLALAAGLEATAHAGADPAALPAVFSSSGGDGENCHEICATLAGTERALSPTRFHNSVHNAAAGYWGIATGATPASNALCAFDASFGAALLEALVQLATEGGAVLLVAYDTANPEPLFSVRPIPDAFGVALVLAALPSQRTRARLACTPGSAPPERMRVSGLEALRRAVPAARSLPLLGCLAAPEPAQTVLEYLGNMSLTLSVEPCR